jgi:hypothetical protein
LSFQYSLSKVVLPWPLPPLPPLPPFWANDNPLD